MYAMKDLTTSAEGVVGRPEQIVGRGEGTVRVQCFHTAENGLGGLAGELLVADGLDKRFEGGLGAVGFEAAWAHGVDQSGEDSVGVAKMDECFLVHRIRLKAGSWKWFWARREEAVRGEIHLKQSR